MKKPELTPEQRKAFAEELTDDICAILLDAFARKTAGLPITVPGPDGKPGLTRPIEDIRRDYELAKERQRRKAEVDRIAGEILKRVNGD